MKNKYFAELSRRLKEDGISTGDAGERHLPILLRGQVAMNVMEGGAVYLMPEASGNQEAGELYHKVSGLASAVKEYTSAMDWAPPLEAVGLDKAEGYRLLADFNGVVLAGQELEKDWGYQFATWVRSPDRTGLAHGDFYWNDFAGAKLSFAGRSGLVQTERLFTDEQLTGLYLCSDYFLEEGFEPAPEQMNVLTSARKQIEEAVPDLQKRLEQGQVHDPVLDM